MRVFTLISDRDATVASTSSATTAEPTLLSVSKIDLDSLLTYVKRFVYKLMTIKFDKSYLQSHRMTDFSERNSRPSMKKLVSPVVNRQIVGKLSCAYTK